MEPGERSPGPGHHGAQLHCACPDPHRWPYVHWSRPGLLWLTTCWRGGAGCHRPSPHPLPISPSPPPSTLTLNLVLLGYLITGVLLWISQDSRSLLLCDPPNVSAGNPAVVTLAGLAVGGVYTVRATAAFANVTGSVNQATTTISVVSAGGTVAIGGGDREVGSDLPWNLIAAAVDLDTPSTAQPEFLYVSNDLKRGGVIVLPRWLDGMPCSCLP
jgi:hypothetical protein